MKNNKETMFNKWLSSKKAKRWFIIEHELYSRKNKYLNNRETMIVFVYDTECLKDEADDPVNAVLYFHPSWVSDTQKVALCGQLMGTSYFLKDCFFKPRILALQNGKFVLKEFGRFTLAVGTDRNISDYLLQYRADLLSSMVRFFHRDLQSIYNQFPLSEQSKNLAEKLYHIFETYLPILQHKGNIFQNVPKLRMPKTGGIIFLDAIQTLQCCQQTKGVLGGAILYHNKVVATQLDDQITKQLVLTDPMHVRTTAEHLHSVDFHIPNGVQMLVIYIEGTQYQQLVADAHRIQTVQTRAQQRQQQQQQQGPQSSTGGAMPAQFTKRKMKRDQSLIFTNIPEEGPTTSAAARKKEEAATRGGGDLNPDDNDSPTQTEEIDSPPTLPPSSFASRPSLARPTHLPLRFKNMTTRDLPESGIASINFDENGSFPEFIGHTSVCSTPMTENKILNLDSHMSIIANPEKGDNSDGAANITPSTSDDSHRRRNSLKIDIEKFFQNFISNPNKMERRNSFTDLQDSLKKISKKLSLKKKISNGVKTGEENPNACSTSATPADLLLEDAEDNDSATGSDNRVDQTKQPGLCTITDPTNPMFNDNGRPISRSLFQEFLERYYKLWDTDTKQQAEVADLIAEFKEFDDELQKLDNKRSSNTTKNNDDGDESANPTTGRNLNLEKVKTPLDKKSLSLPLKPLTDATPSEGAGAVPFGGFGRKQSGGIPLTPLMAKLSVLALNEERGTGWEPTTPGGVEIQTPLDAAKVFRRRGSNTTTAIKCDEAVDALAAQNTSKETTAAVADNLQRVELYICGQQNMTLLLLLEQGMSAKQPLVQSMFDICVAKFPTMENQLNEILNANVENHKSEGDYSFICLDTKWGALQCSGAWNPVELNTLESINRDLQLYDLTDLLLRCNESVFFGYKCGRTEFFYKESAHQTTGIPPPSDPMGNIVMRAKNRLERDHSYVLL